VLKKRTYQILLTAAAMWWGQCHAQDLSGYGVKKGISMTGGLNFNTVAYQTTGKQLGRREPFNWFLSAMRAKTIRSLLTASSSSPTGNGYGATGAIPA
jgi:hypothetical protein